MANKEQLEILKQGVEAWNKWREDNPEIKIDLAKADLSGESLRHADLSKADLGGVRFIDVYLGEASLRKAYIYGANLSEAYLREADISEAYLRSANLNMADLQWANLSKADLNNANLNKADLSNAVLNQADLSNVDLSGTLVNESTIQKTSKIIGGQIGVNGIWVESTDSAALIALIPPGNSMQGSNPEAVIESLKRSRRLHGFSMGLVGIVILSVVLKLDKIAIRSIGVDIPTARFGLLAMFMSLCLLCLASLFMNDALQGARYLNDRKSAMTAGNFPWVLSKYTSKSLVNQIQSFIIRLIMSFHPLIYIYYLNEWLQNWEILNIVLFDLFIIILLFFSVKIFFTSQEFQKPILFDRKTEEERQDNLSILMEISKTIKEQTEVIKDLANEFKPKQAEKEDDIESVEGGSFTK